MADKQQFWLVWHPECEWMARGSTKAIATARAVKDDSEARGWKAHVRDGWRCDHILIAEAADGNQ